MKRVYILLECTLEKEGQIPDDLVAKVEDRAFRIDGIDDTSGRLLTDSESFTIAKAWVDSEKSQEGAKSSLRDAINRYDVAYGREA